MSFVSRWGVAVAAVAALGTVAAFAPLASASTGGPESPHAQPT